MLGSNTVSAVSEQGSARRRARVGDLIEIRTPAGLAYAQYVGRDAALGPQLRVLPATFEGRPSLSALASQKAVYYVHFPLGAAVSRGLVALVGNEPLPQAGAAPRPENDLFRLQEIWNDTLLAERIASNWRPT
jgi:hypothetical protein